MVSDGCRKEFEKGRAYLTMIVCEMLGANDTVKIGLHEFLDDYRKWIRDMEGNGMMEVNEQ